MSKILNYGSLNIDKIYAVEDIVSPGETISSIDYSVSSGGKGLNQSVAAAKAGATVFHAGSVGEDGKFLIDMLQKNRVNTDFISINDAEVTGHAIIQVNKNGENCILIHGGSNQNIPVESQDGYLKNFDEQDILILQNEVNGNIEIIEKAAQKNMRIALNPSPFNSKIDELPLDKIHWLLINEVEGKEISGQSDPEKICEALLEKYPQIKIVLTLGSKGVIYQDKNIKVSCAAHKVPVVDTTAAGDTFSGFFLANIALGKSIEESLDLASKAAAITVTRKGAAPSIPSLAEVLRF